MPCTAAITGTLAYLRHIDAFWNSATYVRKQFELAGGDCFGDLLEVGAKGKRRLMPQHQALIIGLGTRHGFLQTDDDVAAKRMIARLDADDGDAGVDLRQRPQAHPLVLPDRFTGNRLLAQHPLGEDLPLIDGQRRARPVGVGARRIRALCGMHTLLGDLAENPRRQRYRAHCQAGVDVGLDRFGNRLPAGGLPAFEWTLRPAETPAHGEVEVARVVGDVGEVEGGVVENVAEDRPQELRLRMLAGPQLAELLGGITVLEDRQHRRVDVASAVTVVLKREVEDLDCPAVLAEDAAARLLPQRALADQRRQPCWHAVVAVPGVAGQRVLHGLDDVRQRIEPDDIGGAVGGALRATDDRTGERIDDVEAKTETLGVMHHCENRENTDAIGNEVGRIQRPNDAFAKTRDQPGLEVVEQRRVGGPGRNQFNQVHVARRVEEMDAAEARTQCFRQTLRQAVDRQA
jgi:hypothetical protein